MKSSRIRRSGPKTAAFVYAGYKWLEEHADDVERWSDNAARRARGKSYDKVVGPAAQAVKAAAQWARKNQGGSGARSRSALKK